MGGKKMKDKELNRMAKNIYLSLKEKKATSSDFWSIVGRIKDMIDDTPIS